MKIHFFFKKKVKATFADKTYKLGIDGSNFNEEFILLQFHFHWGWNDYEGLFS